MLAPMNLNLRTLTQAALSFFSSWSTISSLVLLSVRARLLFCHHSAKLSISLNYQLSISPVCAFSQGEGGICQSILIEVDDKCAKQGAETQFPEFDNLWKRWWCFLWYIQCYYYVKITLINATMWMLVALKSNF